MFENADGSLTLIKSALEITKGVKDLFGSSPVKAAAIQAQLTEKLLAAYTADLALIEREREIRRRNAELEAWEPEKRRYELKQLGAGPFVYAIKEAERGEEPFHQICANCYHHGRKSILQPMMSQYSTTLTCHECKIELIVA